MTDERILPMQEYYDDGAFYQGLSRSIPLTIPIDNYIQTMATGGDIPATLATIDADWPACAARLTRRFEDDSRFRHDDSHRTAAASAGSLVDEAEHGRPTILAGAAHDRRGRLRVDPIYYLVPDPDVGAVHAVHHRPGGARHLLQLHELHRVRRVAVHRAHQLHRRVLRPGDPRGYSFTFGFAIVTVLLVNVIAFLLAVGLTSRASGLKTGLRAVFVIPMVISGIVIAYVFNFLFSNSLPALGTSLGIPWLSESILANPDLAWLAIVIVTAWQSIPGTLLIYIAGLLSIPGEVYEAADIDGASATWALVGHAPPRRGVRRDQRHPRLQELPERVRRHRRPHQRRPERPPAASR